MTVLSRADQAPNDPIFGLIEQFNADPRPEKVNLAIGVYCGEDGKIPLLDCVRAAEDRIHAAPAPRNYLPMDGIAAYDNAVKGLLFGPDSALVASGRVVTAQALGGTGGLKLGADLLHLLAPGATALISDPTWDNHRALFGQAGFKVAYYPYYDEARRGVDFDGMLGALHAAPPGAVAVLHACCHNPTGYDITPAQWDAVIAACQARSLIPFLDIAYQGFGDGIAEDGAVIAKFAASGLEFLVASSFSKSFSLYGERVGALTVVCASGADAARVHSQVKLLVRTNYSNPPTHGARTVATVLTDPALRALWEQELAGMRERIKALRAGFVAKLAEAGVARDMSFVARQRGMFSYSGLSADQMRRLRSAFGIYGLDTGRICVAALNTRNLDYVAKAIAKVV
jgi:aromatic-amino-acid transaminase